MWGYIDTASKVVLTEKFLEQFSAPTPHILIYTSLRLIIVAYDDTQLFKVVAWREY
jgi:hypothetical protein